MFSLTRHLALAVLIITSLFSSSISLAQPAGARGDNFIYIMQEGDTLGIIAERFTSKPGNWRKIKAYNKISQNTTIPVGKEILVPFKLIDTLPDEGKVIGVSGEVTINNKTIQIGSIIKENDRIETGNNSTVTFKLSNDNVIAISPNSLIYIQHLRQFCGTGLVDAIFKTEQGEFAANVESNNGGVGRFEIRTPVSITGVRGTSLRSRVDENGHVIVELLSGKAAVASSKRPAKETIVPANQGAVISAKGSIIKNQLPDTVSYQTELGTNDLTVTLNPISNAQYYLIRFTLDEKGILELARSQSTATINHLELPNVNKFYVQVRAIDKKGLSGADTATLVSIPVKSESDSKAGASLPAAQ
ncbi:FecR domain-containing protein [Pelistega sp. MC2]|uniref:FecR domain-containing protein n=1 Tax=Pelistega sp. MC2 TaxID=1720297 RepID=UPI0008DA0BBE|nr:FecR domain-containing protein [Pelistega sp. MC2]